jgi:hypothetical protein
MSWLVGNRELPMFNEENTVEQMVLDMLCCGVTSNMVAKELANYGGACNRNQGGLLHGI